MVTNRSDTTEPGDYQEMTVDAWLSFMRTEWSQGEHITLLGPTGTGKTSLARSLISIRTYAVAIATKRADDTLETFKKHGFTVIKKWPPEHWQKHVVYWLKPESLDRKAVQEQIQKVHDALNSIYLVGGWAVFLDEAGYMSTTLKQGMEIGMLMSQARSSKLSIICGVQRPHSISGQIPLEILNQARHHIFFKYDDKREIKYCAEIAGMDMPEMKRYMAELRVYNPGTKQRHTDFLYVGDNAVIIVRTG